MHERITIKAGSSGIDGEKPPSTYDYTDSRFIGINEGQFCDLARTILRHRWLITTITVVSIVIASVIVMFIPNQYVSYASILPSGKVSKLGEFENLSILSNNIVKDENSSELFPIVIKSQLIQNAVLDKTYIFAHDGRNISMTLHQYFERENPDMLRKQLDGITSVSMDKKTGVIDLSVETTTPELSQAVVSEYLTQLESYNLYKRRSQAKDNALYLSRQIEIIRGELVSAEDRLQQFQQVNSDWAGSTDPELIKEMGRLQREVDIKSQTYRYLMQEYESAKLEAQKDVPIVRVLGNPSLPTMKSRPKRTMMVSLVGAITFIGMLFIVAVVDAVPRWGSGPNKEAIALLQRDLQLAFPRSKRLINRIQETLESRTGTFKE